MSTTKKGKLIHQVKPYDVQLKKLWRIGRECGRLAVQYRMGHTLEAMDVELRSTDWTNIVGRKSSKDRPSSSSSVELQGSPHTPESSERVSPPDDSGDDCTHQRHKEASPSLQATPPLSVSPPTRYQQPAMYLAQNPAGGLICFPSIVMSIKPEPEDDTIDMTSLQKCP